MGAACERTHLVRGRVRVGVRVRVGARGCFRVRNRRSACGQLASARTARAASLFAARCSGTTYSNYLVLLPPTTYY